MPKEKQVIDFDPTQGRATLPGAETETPASRQHTDESVDTSRGKREPASQN
jgi:hypothetical protein